MLTLPAFLEKGLKENPMKCEYYLPGVVSDLLGENRATVAVLKSADKWYGVTYKEDKPVVMEAIRKMEEEDCTRLKICKVAEAIGKCYNKTKMKLLDIRSESRH